MIDKVADFFTLIYHFCTRRRIIQGILIWRECKVRVLDYLLANANQTTGFQFYGVAIVFNFKNEIQY
jgi:hypothetical protein